MKLTYLNLANQAVTAEKDEDYTKASVLWGKAKDLAKHGMNQMWAEYRMEHNALRNSFNKRADKWRIKKEKNREAYLLKKQADLLAANINKSKDAA
ncbi:ANR family transcriptional regulator [Morganella psychrotolerans]|uniref:ANR family transcriptional regulator n=1 Tax=Morganella psychrotolerans TaxID=368603 RepID=A0A1B8HU58_9GAMM|nr:ANR family transcriptional regulator [Morganella psychrotolerans]OBU13346.1 hypothetical protein AYY18_00940 [Morganella psychrotolerans]